MNYYNYFTEIEEHFQRKRGAQIWISPVDWALIASWQEAGIPLAAVLAGIDQAFEKFDSGRRRDHARPRALAYCAAAVQDAAEAARQASVGAHEPGAAARGEAESGFSRERIRAHLAQSLAALAASPALDPAHATVVEVREALTRLQDAFASEPAPAPALQELDRTLTVLDEKLLALLQQAAPVDVQVALRGELERELAPYRRKLPAAQFGMIERQFLHRRLLERAQLPRLSLFFMG